MANEAVQLDSSLFISYSRKDKEFVRKLNDALDAKGIKAWVDWEGIPLSSDWMAEITRAIEGGDSFLFVISPDSLASEVCASELNLGLKYNKKLIPILYRDPNKGQAMHEKLASTNWVYLREQDDFDGTIPKLVEAINTDLGWVRQHTRLLQRAVEWDSKKRDSSFLLQGADLQEAEQWMVQAASASGREVVPMQVEYITTSRTAAEKRQRNFLIGVSVAMVVSIALAIVAVFQWNSAVESQKIAVANEHKAATAQVVAEQNAEQAKLNAEEAKLNAEIAKQNEAEAKANENIASAERSAAQAQILQGKAARLYDSTLLAIDSWLRTPSELAEDILRQNIALIPPPLYQMKHGNVITNMQISADKAMFVTPSKDGKACVWRFDTGENVFCVEHNGAVYDAVFTIDGKQLITASADGRVSKWSMTDGSFVADLYNLPDVWMYDLTRTNDGRWLGVARSDGYASLYDLESDHEFTKVHIPGAEIYSVRFSPNDDWMGIAASNGAIKLWRIENTLTGPTHEGEAFQIGFSPDSRWIVSVGEDSTARMGNVAQGGTRFIIPHGDWVEDVIFSPDGSWFVTGSDDHRVYIWDTATAEEKLRMEQEDFVLKVRISPDGNWIASTGEDKTARVWNAATGTEEFRIPLAGRGSMLLFSPDNKKLIVGDQHGNVTGWDISTLASRVGMFEFSELVHEARFSPDGKWISANADDKKVWLLEADQWQTTRIGTEGKPIIQAKDLTYNTAFSPDSNWLVVAESDNNRALLYNLGAKTQTKIDIGEAVQSVAFSPKSDQLLIASVEDQLVLWDLAKGEEIIRHLNPGTILTAAFHPQKDWIAVGNTAQILIFDSITGSIVFTLEQPGDNQTLAFSNDGNWLASSTLQGVTQLWHWNGNGYEKKFDPFTSRAALALEFNPDTTLLAVGAANGSAYVIDLATGQEINRILHADKVSGVSFSADGSKLITVARKVVQVWDVASLPRLVLDDLAATACSRLSNAQSIGWKLLFPNSDYSLICPELPLGR
jgi:WD40 repeat protein